MKVLVADDNAMARLVVTGLLKEWGYDVTAVADGDEAWRVLTSDDGPRLAVLDWKMPGRDGPTICADLRKSERSGYTYVMLLTALERRANLVEGMESGADDYVVKPFEPGELRVRLRAGQRILELEAQLTAAREAYRQLATHDSLTGVLSRGAILDVLEREQARARRTRTPVAVALCDLDRFKRINDAHGHPAGDAVLVESARRMGEVVREADAVGRMGGEEFLAVLPGADAIAAVTAAERIRARVATSTVQTPGGPLGVTVSVGVSSALGEVSAEALISAADKALYLAKQEGRDRVRFLRPGAR